MLILVIADELARADDEIAVLMTLEETVAKVAGGDEVGLDPDNSVLLLAEDDGERVGKGDEELVRLPMPDDCNVTTLLEKAKLDDALL